MRRMIEESGRDPDEVNPTVHVAGWVYGDRRDENGIPLGGGAGFVWYFTRERAERAMKAEIVSTDGDEDEWAHYVVDVRVSSFEAATDDIDRILFDLEEAALVHHKTFVDATEVQA
jgi:hypothetical protein